MPQPIKRKQITMSVPSKVKNIYLPKIAVVVNLNCQLNFSTTSFFKETKIKNLFFNIQPQLKVSGSYYNEACIIS